MKIVKLINITCLAALSALGVSASYAQENRGSVFLMGEVGINNSLVNCSGTCSADPSGTVGMGLNGDWMIDPDIGAISCSMSLEYSRYQFNINGNIFNAVRKTINLTVDEAFDEQNKYVLSLGTGLGWMTVSGPNALSRTTFNPPLIARLFFQVNPALYLSLGYSHEFILSSNQPDFIANSVDIGLRWYL